MARITLGLRPTGPRARSGRDREEAESDISHVLVAVGEEGHELVAIDAPIPVGGENPVCRKITGFCGCWYVPQEGNNCKADEVFGEHGCKLLVVFSSTCQYCSRAAEAESFTDQANRLPTVWLTDEGAPEAKLFDERVHPDSRIVYSPDVRAQLQINAVPASFVVNADGRIVRRTAYSGTEDHEALRALCEV